MQKASFPAAIAPHCPSKIGDRPLRQNWGRVLRSRFLILLPWGDNSSNATSRLEFPIATPELEFQPFAKISRLYNNERCTVYDRLQVGMGVRKLCPKEE